MLVGTVYYDSMGLQLRAISIIQDNLFYFMTPTPSMEAKSHASRFYLMQKPETKLARIFLSPFHLPNHLKLLNPTQLHMFMRATPEYTQTQTRETTSPRILPATRPVTNVIPMKAPASSLSSSGTHTGTPIMLAPDNHPWVTPKRNWTQMR